MPLLLLLLGALSLPLVHEGAHAVAALLVGGRHLRLVRRGFELSIEAELPTTRAAAVCFYAAGPTANLALAVVLGLLAPRAGELALWVVVAAAAHGLFGALNLWPSAGRDGAGIVQALWPRSLCCHEAAALVRWLP
jgi:hypothetical protein